MTTLSAILEDELSKNPFLQECFALGICNVTGLAKHLKPTIESRLMTTVGLPALGMAIRRHCAQLEKLQPRHPSFPKHIDISARTGIFELALARSETNRKAVDSIRQKVLVEHGDVLAVVEGLYEIVLFTNQKYKVQIKKLIKGKKPTSQLDNLGLVTVNWPASTKAIPGIYYRITRALAMRRLSIQSFHTIGAEMMILFSEREFSGGYETIYGLLNNSLKA